MESMEVFAQGLNFGLTIFALFILFFSCFLTGKNQEISSSLWLLFWGMFFEFLAGYIEDRSVEAYSTGASITGYAFAELLLLVGALICMALGATRVLVHKIPGTTLVLCISGLGIFGAAFFTLIFPDGNMVNKMRQIFPLTAYLLVALAFLSVSTQKNHSGYLFAGIISAVVALYLFLRLTGIDSSLLTPWYLPFAGYSLYAMSFMLINNNALMQKLEKSHAEIEKYNKRIEDILKSSPFPIIISRLSDDKIIMANNNAIKLFGINAQELERYHLKDFFADSQNRQLLNERLEKEKEVQDFEILVKTPTSDTPFWLLASANVIDYNYNVVLYSAFQDITSRKNRENLLKNQAIRDPLTSLYNRRYYEEEVNKKILEAKAKQQPFSVLMLDADLFKRVNDTFGHKIGDKVLIEIANVMEKALRENDIIARYGGEEFVVFLPNINADQGRGVAERLRESIGASVVYSDEEQPVRFTVSIGVSSSDISDNVDTLIKTADEALYKAKQNGRNRVEVFTRADMETFIKQGQTERRDESQNHHPVFDKENNAEISLLDGVEAQNLEGNTTEVRNLTQEGDA